MRGIATRDLGNCLFAFSASFLIAGLVVDPGLLFISLIPTDKITHSG